MNYNWSCNLLTIGGITIWNAHYLNQLNECLRILWTSEIGPLGVMNLSNQFRRLDWWILGNLMERRICHIDIDFVSVSFGNILLWRLWNLERRRAVQLFRRSVQRGRYNNRLNYLANLLKASTEHIWSINQQANSNCSFKWKKDRKKNDQPALFPLTRLRP